VTVFCHNAHLSVQSLVAGDINLCHRCSLLL